MSRTWMHCNWTDAPKHARDQIARDLISITERFCKSADRQKLRRREEAFVEKLKEYAYYALSDNARDAKIRMIELEKML